MKQVSRKSGQALVEYAVLVMVMVGVFFTINRIVVNGIANLWLTLGKEITAACPDCTPPDEVR